MPGINNIHWTCSYKNPHNTGQQDLNKISILREYHDFGVESVVLSIFINNMLMSKYIGSKTFHKYV